MLTRYSLRRSLPLLFGLFALLFGLLLLSIELPRSEREALESWRKHTGQMLALQQSSLADHLRQGRMEELHTELADLGSLEDVRWAAVLDQHQQIIAATAWACSCRSKAGWMTSACSACWPAAKVSGWHSPANASWRSTRWTIKPSTPCWWVLTLVTPCA